VTSTDNETISNAALNVLTFDETKGVVLKKTETGLIYEAALKTEQHRCLCVQKIPFPRKKSDIIGLRALQDNLAQEIGLLTDTVKISFSKIERSLLTLPKLKETELGQPISTVSMQSKLEEKIVGLEELNNRTVHLWKNIYSYTDIAEILTVQRKFVQTIRYIERFSRDILEEPLFLLEKGSLNDVGPESIISLGLSMEDSRRLLVTLEAKTEADRIQGGREVEGNVSPFTTQSTNLDPLSTQAATFSTETTSTSSVAPPTQTTTTTTSMTTTTSYTTTITYWYEAAAPGFAETWWVWIQTSICRIANCCRVAPPKYLFFDNLGYFSRNSLFAQFCIYPVQNL
jgi:hypothetical protein